MNPNISGSGQPSIGNNLVNSGQVNEAIRRAFRHPKLEDRVASLRAVQRIIQGTNLVTARLGILFKILDDEPPKPEDLEISHMPPAQAEALKTQARIARKSWTDKINHWRRQEGIPSPQGSAAASLPTANANPVANAPQEDSSPLANPSGSQSDHGVPAEQGNKKRKHDHGHPELLPSKRAKTTISQEDELPGPAVDHQKTGNTAVDLENNGHPENLDEIGIQHQTEDHLQAGMFEDLNGEQEEREESSKFLEQFTADVTWEEAERGEWGLFGEHFFREMGADSLSGIRFIDDIKEDVSDDV
ncbi:hypothetical protein QBC41DRAFT_298617 [Cercophora samala]|uniref:Uncharacterized protein n=1 Tax=Cercophora samala TaxID=330535 RepID=A0AA39ZLP9_9PEZI|nr:hypothetical protein QBC41DRAFT_298617 [Cercophora samala]